MTNLERENQADQMRHWLIVGANLIKGGIIKGDINPLLKKVEENLGPNWQQIIKGSLDSQELIEKGRIDGRIKPSEQDE